MHSNIVLHTIASNCMYIKVSQHDIVVLSSYTEEKFQHDSDQAVMLHTTIIHMLNHI